MLTMTLKRYQIHLAMGVGCFVGLAIALNYLQAKLGQLPCPMCVIQRIIFIILAIIALIAAAHRPRGVGRRVYDALLALFALAGIGESGWQVWLTYHPQLAECGISAEEKFLNALPIAQWWPSMFEANGDCASVTWTLFGLSVPELSLIAFVVMLALTAYAATRQT